jgi:bifunctional non-homologous end joining protein LigD
MEKLTKVSFSNLDKILFPKLKATKAQLIEYYIKMAPKMLPILRDRPIVLTRYPEGVKGEGFYAKNAPQGMPEWVKTIKFYSPSAKHYVNYIICNDLDTLIWLANLAAIEIHIPLSRADEREKPDFAFFDVDPEPPCTFDEAARVALLIKEKLDQLGLRAFIKTSGKKGLHILVPIARGYSFQETRNFVHAVGMFLMKECDIVVSEFADTKKPGRVFVDYTQNSHGRTMVSPYSLRVAEEATVSMPIEWADLKKKLKPTDFNIFSVPGIRRDPWKDIFSNRQKLEAKELEQENQKT